jgi:hypothetical protein
MGETIRHLWKLTEPAREAAGMFAFACLLAAIVMSGFALVATSSWAVFNAIL